MPEKEEFVVTDENWDTVRSRIGYHHVVPYLEFLYGEIQRLKKQIKNQGTRSKRT